MPSMTFYSGTFCPYAQRVAIVAAEKGVVLDRVMVDLADRPAAFLKISPLGKIPALDVDGTGLFESIVIAEYLDEILGTPLHPTDPLERARHRAWMEYANVLFGSVREMVMAADKAAFDRSTAETSARLDRLEEVLVDGPISRVTFFT